MVRWRHGVLLAAAGWAVAGCADRSAGEGQPSSASSSTSAKAPPPLNELDGLPPLIPPPGSRMPTAEEWDLITREVTVRVSSELHCETKMIREWLRVSCDPRGADVPVDVKTTRRGHQQAYVFNPPPGAAMGVVV